MSTVHTPAYQRAPSEELGRLLAPGGLLRPLVSITTRRVNNLELDVHLRSNDEVQVYCGLTRILNVRRNRNGTVSLSAHQRYGNQGCAKAILRQWRTDEVNEFSRALDAYLDGVKVAPRHTAGEGAVQSMWSRVKYPWVPFDREAVLSYRSGGALMAAAGLEQVKRAHTELEAIAESQQWTSPPTAGGEVDQLAVDQEGRLVIAELKTCFGESGVGLLHAVSAPALRLGVARRFGIGEERVAGPHRCPSEARTDPMPGPQAHRRDSGCRLLWPRRQERRGEGPVRQGVGCGEQTSRSRHS